MKPIPFCTFDGYLKQHAHDALSTLEQDLFNTLFPCFYGDDEAANAYRLLRSSLLGTALGGLLRIVPGDRRQRRFSGHNLPPTRYYSVAKDVEGNDNQTLAHELRAYRNPVPYGMVEVIDLSGGCNLVLNDTEISLPPGREIAVLIHNSHQLPQRFLELPFQRLQPFNDEPVLLFRFPYHVLQHRIDRVIDLRQPVVQEWFFETFKLLPSSAKSGQSEKFPDSTIAYSRFHLSNGRAPIPTSFWSMLPTLMNPDLGGGNPGTTGSTVLSIGHWMRQHDVNAFVYPSARCDVEVVIENGQLSEFAGWNLVYYRGSRPFGASVNLTTFDPSPWAWVGFGRGIELHLATVSNLVGSFKVGGMVNYWSEEYLSQIRALKVARGIHGPEPSAGLGTKEVRSRGFSLGVLSLRWLRYVFRHQPSPVVSELVYELLGLSLSMGVYDVAGRIGELWNTLKEGGAEFNSLVRESVQVADRIGRAMAQKYPEPFIGELVQFGSDLEFLLLSAEVVCNRARAPKVAVPSFAERYGEQINLWFGATIAKELVEFLKRMQTQLSNGSEELSQQLRVGESLIDVACRSLRV